MNWALRIFGAAAAASVFVYAFTGRALWVDLNTGEGGDAMRFLLLLAIHGAGIVCGILSLIPDD
jgi:hypothetical protein